MSAASVPEAEAEAGVADLVAGTAGVACVPHTGRETHYTDAAGRTLRNLGTVKAGFVLAENVDNSPYDIRNGNLLAVSAVGPAVGHAVGPAVGHAS